MTAVKRVRVGLLIEAVRGQNVVLGIDVAKEAMVAAVMDEGAVVLSTIRWSHPAETSVLVDLMEALRGEAAGVDVAMESSGSYGDALRWQFIQRGFEVHRVSAKKTHDMAEIYDGVPSKHDAKDAAIISKLHLDGTSTPWPVKPARERELAAALRLLEMYDKQMRQNQSRLEARLARHWPELTGWLSIGSATLVELLGAYGGAEAVAADAEGARRLMVRVGRSKLSEAKVDGVIRSASETVGLPQIEEEERLLRTIASDTRRAQLARRESQRRIEALAEREGATRELQAVVGKTTSAVLVATVGDPRNYDSAGSYVKALGLNLRERSSGKKKGQLHITKRGSSTARRWLYLATLRLLAGNAVVQAWYASKVARDGGRAKVRAVVAVMRKLAMALWHVAGGARFDAAKLFDTRRLTVAS